MPIIYSVAELISEAFYTSGIISRQFQQVDGNQVQTGFLKLNEILTETSIMDDMVPYFTTQYNFYGVQGQQQYFIPNLVKLETLVFYINGVIRYYMERVSQDYQFGSARVENIQTLPYTYHCERAYQQVTPPPTTVTVTQINSNYIVNGAVITITDTNISSETIVASVTMVTSANNVTVLSATPSPNILTVICSGAPGANWTLTYTEATPVWTPGSNIFVYFFPDQAYLFMATGLFQLRPVTSVSDDLGTMFDSYYITYLQYRLAERLCIAYNFTFPAPAQKLLSEYQMAISKRSAPMDLTLNKITTMGVSNAINYAMANLGKGWTV